MYPISSSNGNTNPIIIPYSLDDHHQHQDDHQPSIIPYNPNSKQEVRHHHSSLFHFPSPYIHYDDQEDIVFQRFHDLLDHQNMAAGSNNNNDFDEGNLKGGDCNQQRDIPEKVIPRKRSSKKDRHSKINTAQGPRDRRMRLSLQVAGKFFRLQDMLGFDKASKTVEWLLVKSKSAIEELSRSLPGMKHSSSTASSTSECEVVSGVNDGFDGGGGGSNGGGDGQAVAEERVEKNSSSTRSSANRKKTTSTTRALKRKSAFHPLARESREKARARARERASKKRIMLINNESKLPQESLNREMNGLLWSWSPFENGEESGTQSYNNNINNNPHLEVLPPDVEELSSSMIFNYDPHNSGMSQEHHQFTDFQVYEKPWEAYDNINLC